MDEPYLFSIVICGITVALMLMLFNLYRKHTAKTLEATELHHKNMLKILDDNHQEKVKTYSREIFLLTEKIEKMQKSTNIITTLKTRLLQGVTQQNKSLQELKRIAEEVIEANQFFETTTGELFACITAIEKVAGLDPEEVKTEINKILQEKN